MYLFRRDDWPLDQVSDGTTSSCSISSTQSKVMEKALLKLLESVSSESHLLCLYVLTNGFVFVTEISTLLR